MNTPNCEALRENKREMFDGMRAYHESEISHANYGFTALLAVAAGDGAVVMALLFGDAPPEHPLLVVWGLFAFVVVLCVLIALSVHLKIDADHARYAQFGKEYVNTSKALGFYREIDVGGEAVTLKSDETIGQGRGYRKTQQMLWGLAGSIALLTLAFCAIQTCLLRAGTGE